MKLDIGIAVNKNQPNAWWSTVFGDLLRVAQQRHIEINQLLAIGSALTDYNRNKIAEQFLNGDADIIAWIDDDTVPPAMWIERLLDLDADIAAGLYYMRSDTYLPVAYRRMPNHLYTPLKNFKRGEIVAVDSVGYGCTLVKRHVYETIMKEFAVFRRQKTGTFLPIHNDSVTEMKQDALPAVVHQNAGNVCIGSGKRAYHIEPLTGPVTPRRWPFYALEHGRTEDHCFNEMARRCGFKILLDTWVECEHLGTYAFGQKEFREMLNSYMSVQRLRHDMEGGEE